MRNTFWSLACWFVLVASVFPAFHAWSSAEPLDAAPYWLSALAGALLGYPLLIPFMRFLNQKSGPKWLHVSWVTSPLLIAPPLWGIGVLLTLNVELDSSPSEEHASVLLRQGKCGKAHECAYFSSWRTPGEEERLKLETLRTVVIPQRDIIPAGASVTVVTRSGRLGFDYVSAVRRR